MKTKRIRSLLAGAALAASTLGAATVLAEPAGAYTPWACGSQTYKPAQSSASTTMLSTVAGCKQRVVITCKPPLTGQIYGPLRLTGQTSTANCPSGKILNSGGWQMGTGW